VDYWRACAKQGKSVDARIINTSSGAGLNGSIAQSAYAAAKGGIASLTLVQAAELQRYGITANALAPAARTRMTEQAFAEKMKRPESGFDVQDPDNIAPAVVWLGSTESRAVSGCVFELEGGKIMIDEGWNDGPQVDKQARWEPREVGPVVAPPAGSGGRRRRSTAHEHTGRDSALSAGPRPAGQQAAGDGGGRHRNRLCHRQARARGRRARLRQRRARATSAEAVEQLRAIDPQRVEGKLCDVTRRTTCGAGGGGESPPHGRHRRWVNNAGLGVPGGLPEMTTINGTPGARRVPHQRLSHDTGDAAPSYVECPRLRRDREQRLGPRLARAGAAGALPPPRRAWPSNRCAAIEAARTRGAHQRRRPEHAPCAS
jgi:NAD(P)-dependent dehydrogenase (short-subunit alcohol dehydrogenase family)